MSSFNHSQYLLEEMNADRKSTGKYCDVTVIVEGQEFRAHKCVLGMLSDFYDKMFFTEMKEHFTNEVVIKGVSKVAFEVILEFLYTSEMHLSMDNVYEIFEAGHYLDLGFVSEFCVHFLKKNINERNWLKIRSLALRYDYVDLLLIVDEEVAKKFQLILNSQDFIAIKFDSLKHILSLKQKHVTTENVVYDALMRWMKHNDDRVKYFEDLFALLNLEEITWDFLNQVVAKEILVKNSHNCTKMVLNALIHHTTNSSDRRACAAPVASKTKTDFSTSEVLATSFVAVDAEFVYLIEDMPEIFQMLEHNHGGGAAAKFGSDIYTMGGAETKQVEKFHLGNKSLAKNFSSITNHFRFGAAALCFDRFIFVSGGLSSPSSAEKYWPNPPCEGWSNVLGLCPERHGHAMASLAGLIYIIGGDIKQSRSMLCYNPFSQTTTILPCMKVSRFGLAAVALNNEIYAIGGAYGERLLNVVEKYNPLTKLWKTVASLNHARSYHCACVVHDHILVIGGGSSKVEIYEPKKNTWKVVRDWKLTQKVFAIFPLDSTKTQTSFQAQPMKP